MACPAKAGLGSVPNPAVGAGREAQASLLVQSGTRVARAGGRAGVGDTPTSECGFCAESAGASARAKRVRSGPGWDVQCE